MRRNLHETDDFIASKAVARRESSVKALFNYPREVLLVVGLTMGGTTAFYTYTTYMQKFLKLSVGLTDTQTTLVTAASLIFALFLQPIYGSLSDKIGRKSVLIWFGVAGTLFTIPLLNALQATTSALIAFLLIASAWLIVAGYTSINAVVKAELFPTKVRATGVGLPYALTVSIFGGHRGIDCALVQIHRPRDVVLLLLDCPDRDLARCLRHDARHQTSLCHWPA
jgi:MHS family alpha-ketoglutarate permease-like MFS transporter